MSCSATYFSMIVSSWVDRTSTSRCLASAASLLHLGGDGLGAPLLTHVVVPDEGLHGEEVDDRRRSRPRLRSGAG